MSRLDSHTIILITTLMCLLLSLVLVMLRQSYPPSVKGLGEWAAAIGLSSVSTVMFAMRGFVPDIFSMALAQGMVFSAVYLFYRGCEHFAGLKPRWHAWAISIGVAVLVLAWFSAWAPDYRWYGGLSAGFMGGFFLALAVLLLRRAPALFSTRFTAFVALLQVGISFLCSIATLASFNPFGEYDPTVFRGLFVASLSLCIMGLSVGFILMATERLRGELEQLASRDSLTGALTRRVMADACETELDRYRRDGHDISLLMMDLDHFKKINDTYGHAVGDKVLVDFVNRVQTLLRQPDRLGRFGGEEFLVMLPQTSLDAAVGVAQRIRSAAELASVQGIPPYTVSIGVTVNRAEDAHMNVMLQRADAALYRAKAQGRNQVEWG